MASSLQTVLCIKIEQEDLKAHMQKVLVALAQLMVGTKLCWDGPAISHVFTR